MILKNIFKLSMVLSCFFIFYCAADSFLATPFKRISRGQLKQDIAETLASILDLESRSIELTAKAQQKICNHIRGLAQNSTQSTIVTATEQELKNSLKKLREIESQTEENLKNIVKTLKFGDIGFIEKIKKPQCK